MLDERLICWMMLGRGFRLVCFHVPQTIIILNIEFKDIMAGPCLEEGGAGDAPKTRKKSCSRIENRNIFGTQSFHRVMLAGTIPFPWKICISWCLSPGICISLFLYPRLCPVPGPGAESIPSVPSPPPLVKNHCNIFL